MTILYNLGIRIYYILVFIVSAFNKKAKFWIVGRKNCLSKIEEQIDPNSEYAWFHASSLGEFEQGRPIIEELKKQYPEIKIILTFFSPSGYEIRKNYIDADIISYLPLDTKRNARKFIQIVKPKWTFFIKYEFWYHFLKQTQLSDSKLYLVSGIFRKKQLFFKSYGGSYRKMLTWFNHFFVQNQESAALLGEIGINNVTISGDSRFDRVVQIATQSKNIEIACKFANGSKVIVCGSTWEPDEKILSEYINNAPKDVKLIIAPHEIKKDKIESLIKSITVKSVLYSKAKDDIIKEARVLIIDNIGMLSSIYKYGKISYIGGGFGTGIHNTLEAAVYAAPVVFGPNHQKFQEAVNLINCKGARSVSNFSEFKEAMDNYLQNTDSLKIAGESAGNYVNSNTGATRIILEHLQLD